MATKMKKIIATVLFLSMLFTCCMVPLTANAEENNNLKFDSNGKFKIIIFSDTQDQYVVHPRLTSIMRQAIARENPDLVVFLGDQTEMNTKDPEVDFRRTINQILTPVVEAGVPYAFVFGNHDFQSYYSGTRADKDELLAVYQSIGDCRTTDPNPSLTGTGTCNIPIYSSDGSNVAFNLWMIDSNTYQDPITGNGGYDNPHADQLAWMQSTQTALNTAAGHVVPSMAFQHIPMPEIYNLLTEDANGSKTYGDKTYAKTLISSATGNLGEFPCPCSASNNTGEYAALKSMGVLNLFTGHDHLNDFSGKFEADGVAMTAVPGMTYYNYGSEEVRGYGVVEIDEDDLENYDYHSVKFTTLDEEAGDPGEITYDDYDEVNVSDLKKNGTPVSGQVNIGGGNLFTYDATSESYSAVFKFRWTAGAQTGIQFSFDHTLDSGNNTVMTYPFGVWVKKPNYDSNVGANGAWHFKPSGGIDDLVQMTSAMTQGSTVDVEFGRLKVVSGPSDYVGTYYVYLKADGVLIRDGYTAVDEQGGYTCLDHDCTVSNEIFFADWAGTGNKISDVPVVETYEAYDEIEYSELLKDGSPVGSETSLAGATVFTYNKTSPTGSAILKYRWTVGDVAKVQISFDKVSSDTMDYMFGAQLSAPSANHATGDLWLRPGSGPVVDLAEAIEPNSVHDVEFARLKVANGANAGKYYVYFKLDGNIIAEDYVAADVVDANGAYTSNPGNTAMTLSNEIIMTHWGSSGNKISAIPVPETYEAYDEIEYTDLKKNGSAVGNETTLAGATVFTYNKTSSTGSAILKYRWTVGDIAKVQISFDKVASDTMDYMFGAQLSAPSADHANGNLWLRPGYGPNVDLAEAIEPNSVHDVEFARLKVATGANAGKYYVYFKLDGNIIAEDYVAADVVDANGAYTSNPGSTAMTLSNEIIMTHWGSNGNKISAVVEEEEDPNPESPYYEYDEISYNSLLLNGQPVSGETTISGQTVFTYNRTSPTYSTIFKYRWTAGDVAKFSLFFDQSGAYPFTLVAKYPNQNNFGTVPGENGAWQVNPTTADTLVNLSEPLVPGQSYDIEYGRLKVKNGENAGKYYVYLKVDGEDIVSYYYDGVLADGSYYNGCQLSNNIVFEVWGTSGTTISATPITEEYDTYDELNFNSLLKNGSSVSNEDPFNGSNVYTYNRTSSSFSTILHFNWTAGDLAKFQMSFDKLANGNMCYPYGIWVKAPGDDGAAETGEVWFLPGQSQGVHIPFDHAIAVGETIEFELGRLKVMNGPNAGKYYTYLKMDKELVAEAYNTVAANGQYTFGNSEAQLSSEILFGFWTSASVSTYGKLSPVDLPTAYEPYDEIGYEDLLLDGQPVSGETPIVGQTTFTYNRTSPTYSTIFKYRWTAGSVAKFSLFFDQSGAYPFTLVAKYPNQDNFGTVAGANGAWQVNPTTAGTLVNLSSPLVAGRSYNIEYGRLKVKSGDNAGKYYVYLKVDDVDIVSYYYDGVLADGSYYNDCQLSNNIVFEVYGTEGTKLAAYHEAGSHEGLRGDIDNSGVIDATDVTALKQVILGALVVETDIAEYNLDGAVDVRDLIAMKKDFLGINVYAKSGALTFGMQEHINEDGTGTSETKTPAYIADASAAMGATSFRLNFSLNRLFDVTSNNTVTFNTEGRALLRETINQLKAKGINDIIWVSDAFVEPYGYCYEDGEFVGHNDTVPDPVTEADTYALWLRMNADAIRMLAQEYPEIDYFEPFNEPNLTGTRLEKHGVGWSYEGDLTPYKYTVKEKAGIMADLCWYATKAVKSVDPSKQVTTPAISVSAVSGVELNFADELYNCIESGNYPTGQTVADKRIDNYFTILAIHSYPTYQNRNILLDESDMVDEINDFYAVVQAHGDGGSRVWLTETGLTDSGTRNKNYVAANMKAALEAIDEELPFIESVYIYKLANASEDKGLSASETNFGLFYSGDDLDDPYGIKPIAKTIYSYFHNGSTDYSALNALVSRWS